MPQRMSATWKSNGCVSVKENSIKTCLALFKSYETIHLNVENDNPLRANGKEGTKTQFKRRTVHVPNLSAIWVDPIDKSKMVESYVN